MNHMLTSCAYCTSQHRARESSTRAKKKFWTALRPSTWRSNSRWKLLWPSCAWTRFTLHILSSLHRCFRLSHSRSFSCCCCCCFVHAVAVFVNTRRSSWPSGLAAPNPEVVPEVIGMTPINVQYPHAFPCCLWRADEFCESTQITNVVLFCLYLNFSN